MKRFLEVILASYARMTLKIHKPKIVGITGSVGKSSTKDAIALVLGEKFRVGASSGNLNSQLGLPVSVLGFNKAGGFKKNLVSFFEWFWILVSGFFRIFRPNFPQMLVLEMGADKPGDIAYLLSIVGKLDVAVITDIGISHIEFFPSINSLTEEKLSLLKGLTRDGVAVLNSDNPKVSGGRSLVPGWIYTFGFKAADVMASDYKVVFDAQNKGVFFNLIYKGQSLPVFIPNAVGKPAVYAVLAAAAVGVSQNMSLPDIARTLNKYKQPLGRLHLIEGINNTLVIDDTYNAAPSSTIAAIDAISNIDSKRKLAAIGHMAELGNETEAGHREVADKIASSKLDEVFLVGEKTKIIGEELEHRNFKGKIQWFASSDEAKSAVKQSLMGGDLILIKGSQSARMEKIVKEVMAKPETAKDLLVRQSSQWLL